MARLKYGTAMPASNAVPVSETVPLVQSPSRLALDVPLLSSTHFLGEKEPAVARYPRTILVQTQAAVERQLFLKKHRTVQNIT
jgi:hypothetical protein